MEPHARALPHWLASEKPSNPITTLNYTAITDVTLANTDQAQPRHRHQPPEVQQSNNTLNSQHSTPPPRYEQNNTILTQKRHNTERHHELSTGANIKKTESPNLTPIQSKYNATPRPRMKPDDSIQYHPAFNILLNYAMAGCPVDCGPEWSEEHIRAAIMRGPHISAKSPEAAASIRAETVEKVAQGYARIVKWDDIKDNIPKNLKISPIAAVPHKSRLFRTILDLSFRLRCNGHRMASVNEKTTPKSNHKAMEQMGLVLWRIITTIALADPTKGPIVMAKWDIKDGFWRLTVAPEDAWHFCYVLPRIHDTDPIELAVSTCLQMGWTESPPLFCTATETARDIAQDKINTDQPQQPHALEHMCIPENIDFLPTHPITTAQLAKLLEVYVDDFMGLLQAPTAAELRHFTRAVLHGIHSVFPPPGPNDDQNDEPISIKKLQQGDGLWATRKEILGWLFDGITRCMQLPPDKVTKITTQLKAILRSKRVRFGDIEKLNGKLMHAAIGIPNGRGLLSPLIATLANKPNTRTYKDRTVHLNAATRQALQDWKTLLPIAAQEPTPCQDLISMQADFGGYCDASKHGAGGVWFGLSRKLPPIVWRVQFPQSIQVQVVSQKNPSGKITNSDLEMVGLLLQWIVLEQFTNLAHTHVACWCDNTPTVSWATKLLATKATNAARLLRILALRMIACRASPLTTLHIPGIYNTMADFASRSFDTFPTNNQFLTEFQSRFPLPQQASWICCRLPNATVGRVLSTMSTPTSALASWRRLKQHATVIGGNGPNSFHETSTRTFKSWQNHNDLWSFKFSLDGCGKESSEEETKSKQAASKQHLAPSARQSNWLGSPTHFTDLAQRTIMPP